MCKSVIRTTSQIRSARSGSDKVHNFGSLTSVIGATDGIARIRLTGTVTDASAAAMLAQCAVDLPRLSAWAMVARYDTARLAIDPQTLLACAAPAMDRHAGALRLPTAIVVPADELELWRIYCDLQGRRGVLRKAFTSHADALRWAQEHAELWQAQLSWSVRALSQQ